MIYITAADFSRIVHCVATCSDPDSSRYALGGVQLELSGDTLTATCTDGRQLATTECKISAPTNDGEIVLASNEVSYANHTWLISAADLRKAPILKSTSQVVMLVSAGVVSFSYTNGRAGKLKQIKIDCKMVEGRFPNWRQCLPSKSPAGTAVIDPSQWVKAWRSFRDDSAIKFNINGSVSIKDRPTLNLERIEHTGDDIELKVDFDLLTSHLSTLPGWCELKYRSPDEPLEVVQGKTRYVLMPMGDRR
jgi:DNA polymerase III subunit beta